jgi:Mor family transcriptional regulator
MSFLTSLKEEIVEAAGRCGLTAREALDIARSVEERIRREYGTRRIYINTLSIRDRDERIRKAFDGTNAREICKENKISRPTLYRIVGRSQ